jgi:hypothetical protein
MQANNSGHSSTLEPFTPNSEIGSSDKSNMDTTYDFLVQRKSFVMDTLRGSDIKYLKILEVYERDKYFDQLLPYFQGCSPVESKIRKTRYSQSSLTKLFLSYYSNCSQSKVAFQKQEEKASGEFGVLTGVSISTIRFGNAIGVDYLSNTVFPHSTNFSAGLFYNFILRETQKRWSICNDLIYTSYMLNGVYNNYQDVYNSTTSQTKIGYSYLILNDMLRYNCPIGEGDWSMFFNVGISNGFGFNETNYENEQTMVWSIKNSINGKALNDTRKYEPGFIAGLGVKNKKFSFDARFEIGSGITQDILSEKSLTSRFFFLLGYRIK